MNKIKQYTATLITILLVSNFCIGQTETASKNYVNGATNALWEATTNLVNTKVSTNQTITIDGTTLPLVGNLSFTSTGEGGINASTATNIAHAVVVPATNTLQLAINEKVSTNHNGSVTISTSSDVIATQLSLKNLRNANYTTSSLDFYDSIGRAMSIGYQRIDPNGTNGFIEIYDERLTGGPIVRFSMWDRSTDFFGNVYPRAGIYDAGISWTARTACGSDDQWAGITYGNGLFVAVGQGLDNVMTSPDGINWTARSACGNDDFWKDITYGNGLFVAVGEGVDRVMTSPDGINWTARSACGDDDNWSSITYGNGLFVVVGFTGDRVMTSPDGINWTARSACDNDDLWFTVTYGNGLFVAVGATGDRVMTSPDGINWTARSACGDDDVWLCITYGNGLFVAVGNAGDNIVMTSPDGINWTARTACGNDDTWATITYGNGLFIAVGDFGDVVMTSPDGINWTARTACGNDDFWSAITYGNGLFVVVGAGPDRVMTSGIKKENTYDNSFGHIYRTATNGAEIVNYKTMTNAIDTHIFSSVQVNTNLATAGNITIWDSSIQSGSGFVMSDLGVNGWGNVQLGYRFPTTQLFASGEGNANIQQLYMTATSSVNMTGMVYASSQKLFTRNTSKAIMIGGTTPGTSCAGSVQAGMLVSSATMTNINSQGCIQMGTLNAQHSYVTNSSGCIGLGAVAITNTSNAIVAGHGQTAHGDDSITAGGGFWSTYSPSSNNWMVNYQLLTNTVISATNTLWTATTNLVNTKVSTNQTITVDGTTLPLVGNLSFTSSGGSGISASTATNIVESYNYVTANAINIYENISQLTTASGITNTVTVQPTVPIYRLTATNLNTTIAFDLSNLDLQNRSATWETWIKVEDTNVVITLPPTNLVYYVTTPTLTTTASNQTHYAVWRAFMDGSVTNILCNKWLTK